VLVLRLDEERREGPDLLDVSTPLGLFRSSRKRMEDLDDPLPFPLSHLLVVQ
jgi:hypothetical protein